MRVVATDIHFHAGSEPNFAITSEFHPQGAWVIAKYPAKQQEFYDTACLSIDGGLGGASSIPIVIECERYEDSGNNRRFYWGVTDVRLIGIPLDEERLRRSLPSLDRVIKTAKKHQE